MLRTALASITFLTILTGACRSNVPLKPVNATNKNNADSSHLATLTVEITNDAAIRDEVGAALTGYRFLIQPMEGTICATSSKVDRIGPYSAMDLQETTVPGCDYYVGVELGTLSEDGKKLEDISFSNWDSFDTRFSLFMGDLKAGKELLLQMELPRAKGSITTGTPVVVDQNTPNKRREIIAIYSNTVTAVEDSQASLERYGSILQAISPSWYNLKGDGTVGVLDNGIKKEAIDAAKAKGVRVTPLFIAFDTDAPVLATAASRTIAVDSIAKLVADNGFHGASLVFTFLAADQKANLTAFIDALSTRLHADKKLLYLSVYPKVDVPEVVSGVYDYPALYAKVDRMNIMLQDKAYEATPAGPIAPMPWVEANICYFTKTKAEVACGELGLSPDKILLSVPTYGYDWPIGAPGMRVTEREGFGIGAKYSPDPNAPAYVFDDTAKSPFFDYILDTVSHTMHFETSYSASFKFRLVEMYNLRGITMYQMGGETERWWIRADCTLKISGKTTCQ